MPKSQAHRVLLIDDDAALRATLAEQLRQDGEFHCIEAGSAAAGLAAAAAEHPDIILLDVGLPDGDGREACKRLRELGVTAPVVMLTASTAEADAISGLESGANDYVAKPFRLGELLARLRRHIEQHAKSEDAVLHIGPYVFKPNVKMLIDPARNRKIHLTEKETAIVKYLYRAGERAVPRDKLLGEVWGYNAGVDTHTLETHVYRLRQKIERDPAKAEILLTDAGGYRLAP